MPHKANKRYMSGFCCRWYRYTATTQKATQSEKQSHTEQKKNRYITAVEIRKKNPGYNAGAAFYMHLSNKIKQSYFISGA